MLIFHTKKTSLCFVGDIHGDLSGIQGLMKRTEFMDTAYIFCGDCGFGFNKPTYYTQVLNKVRKTAEQFNNECYFLRGNHDDPSYYDGKTINKDGFYAIPDYTVICTPSHNILCIGGAVSIDRTNRLGVYGKTVMDYMRYHKCSVEIAEQNCQKVYWENELPYYDEAQLDQIKEEGIKIDVVATHTCPSFCYPTDKNGIEFWLDNDPKLYDDLFTERNEIDKIHDKLIADGHPITKWFYGHYHRHNREYIDGIEYVLLDMCRNNNFDLYDLR